ncbi:helix-turn-helix domain-containing protein [Planotetraspora sp. GP83]|uniref:helix-turn-helix domain-containing protein n=1 Tax=Planotetraspora sp. GP83 TaxID=3156264 RepID=UPI0035151180
MVDTQARRAADDLTVEQAARLLSVSKMTVYRLVHSGELPAVRVGRSFRIARRDLDDYLRRSNPRILGG